MGFCEQGHIAKYVKIIPTRKFPGLQYAYIFVKLCKNCANSLTYSKYLYNVHVYFENTVYAVLILFAVYSRPWDVHMVVVMGSAVSSATT